jgi:hypothetical protein
VLAGNLPAYLLGKQNYVVAAVADLGRARHRDLVLHNKSVKLKAQSLK